MSYTTSPNDAHASWGSVPNPPSGSLMSGRITLGPGERTEAKNYDSARIIGYGG
jgi:hypothetical protein